MATSYTVTNVTGTGPFTLPSDIELLPYSRVTLNNQIEVVKNGTTLTEGTDFTINETLNQYTLTDALVSSDTLVFTRVTSTSSLATFIDGARLTADELNLIYRQSALRLEELSEDFNSLVLNTAPGSLPSVGNAGYLLAKVNNTDNTAQWIDFDDSSSIVNLQNQINANASSITALNLEIGTEAGAASTGLYGDIYDAEQLAVDANSNVLALQSQLYGTDPASPDPGTVLFRVNEAESAVTDKLDKVTTSAQSVASEVTFDNAVTLNNTIEGDAFDDIKSNARILDLNQYDPFNPGHLVSMGQLGTRLEFFSGGSNWTNVVNMDDRFNFVIPFSNEQVDELSQGSANSRYVYPQGIDNTAYFSPGQNDDPTVRGRLGLYFPAAHFRPLESETDPSRVNGSDAGDIAAFRAARGIPEAKPGSGNIFGIEGIRAFNALTFRDSTNNVVGQSGLINIDGSGNTVPITSAYERLNFDGTFSGGPRANVLYIPPSNNGGLVKVSIQYSTSENTTDGWLQLCMLTGMDEANESFGPASSVIPVAVTYFDYASSNSPIWGTQTVEYTYDNSDGKPRYFCAAIRRLTDKGTNTHEMSWSVSRAEYPELGNYHSVNTNTPNGVGWSWRRGTYDKFVQNQVQANFVAQ